MAKKIKNKDIDFLAAYYASEKKESVATKNLKYILPLVCLVVVFGSVFGVLKYQQGKWNNDIDEVEAQLKQIKEEKESNGVVTKKQSFEDIKALADELKTNVDNMNTYPQLSKNALTTIMKFSTGVTLSDILYNQSTGELSLSIETAKVAQINTFVTSVRDSGVFSNIVYLGYAETKTTDTSVTANPETGTLSNNNATTVAYTAKVTCIIKEGV